MIKKKIKLAVLYLGGIIVSGFSFSSLVSCKKEETEKLDNSNDNKDFSKPNILEKDEIKDQPDKTEEENKKRLDEKLEKYYAEKILTKNISEEILKAYKSV